MGVIIDGIERVIEWGSRLLGGSELNYGITDLEMLALTYCVGKWLHYIYGRKVVCFTDHQALIHVLAAKDIQRGRLGRSVMFLQPFNLIIKYIPGPDNYVADMVSRPEKKVNQVKCCLALEPKEAEKQDEEIIDLNYKGVDPTEDIALIHILKTGKHISGLSKKQVRRVESKVDQFKINDKGIMFTIQYDKILKNEFWKEIP